MYPILGFIGDTPIVSYYVLNFFGIAAGFVVLFLNVKEFEPAKRNRTIVFALLIFIPFILGARLGNIFESALSHTAQCVSKNILLGPSSIWWGLGLSCILAVPVAKWLKVNVWETADIFALCISIGGVFARLACLLNGCCFGIQAPENYGFAVFYPYGSYPFELFGSVPVYPTQIFESFAWLAIFVILIIRNNLKHFQGELIILTGFLYSIARFFIEFYRYHETPGFPSTAQIFSISIFCISIITWFLKKKQILK